MQGKSGLPIRPTHSLISPQDSTNTTRQTTTARNTRVSMHTEVGVSPCVEYKHSRLVCRQTRLGRSGQETRQGHPDNPFRAAVQHMVVCVHVCVSLHPPLISYVPPAEHATTTLGWACATMRRRRKSGRTTPPPFMPFDANVTCVMVGSRFRRIPRSVA